MGTAPNQLEYSVYDLGEICGGKTKVSICSRRPPMWMLAKQQVKGDWWKLK